MSERSSDAVVVHKFREACRAAESLGAHVELVAGAESGSFFVTFDRSSLLDAAEFATVAELWAYCAGLEAMADR